MELRLTERTQEYRLLMIEPDPETGEKVCVGIVLDNDLVYDASLTRFACFSRSLDVSVARFYLSELRDRIRQSRGSNLDRIMAGYAPIFSYSKSRLLSGPVTESVKLTLLKRFVTQEPIALDVTQEPIALDPSRKESRQRREVFMEKVNKFISSADVNAFDSLIPDATSREVLGVRHRGIAKVALALKGLRGTVIVDGVDLTAGTPAKILNESVKVVHTFWQYKKIEPYRLKRLGLIFNGTLETAEDYRDVHDFVFEKLRSETDETIDTSSVDAPEQIASVLALS